MFIISKQDIRGFELNSPEESKIRSFVLTDRMSPSERKNLLEQLRTYVPDGKIAYIRSLDVESLFLTLLYAFEEEFAGLKKTISSILSVASPEEKDILLQISFLHRYAFASAPIDWLTKITRIMGGSSARLAVECALVNSLDRLVMVESTVGGEPQFVTRHDRISQELTSQLLGTDGTRGSRLSQLALRVLDGFGERNVGSGWEEEISTALLTGTNFSWTVDLRSVRGSRLMSDVRDVRAQESILNLAIAKFPYNAHFPAHLGRLLYEQTDRFDDARKLLTLARTIAENDWRIAHMQGMSYKREMEKYTSHARRLSTPATPTDLIETLSQKARAYFAEARFLEPQSAYGYASDIETLLLLVEFELIQHNARNVLELAKTDKVFSLIEEIDWVLEDALTAYSGDLPDHLANLRVKAMTLLGKVETALSILHRRTDRPDASYAARYQMARFLGREALDPRVSATQSLGFLQESARLTRPSRSEMESGDRRIMTWARFAVRDPKVPARDVLGALLTRWKQGSDLETAFYLMCLSFSTFIINGDLDAKSIFDEFSPTCRRLAEHRLKYGHERPREWLGQHMRLVPEERIRPKFGSDRDTRELLLIRNGSIVDTNSGKVQVLPPHPITIPFSVRSHGMRRIFEYNRGQKAKFWVQFSYHGPYAYGLELESDDSS